MFIANPSNGNLTRPLYDQVSNACGVLDRFACNGTCFNFPLYFVVVGLHEFYTFHLIGTKLMGSNVYKAIFIWKTFQNSKIELGRFGILSPKNIQTFI